MKILELFSGTESFGKVARERGHEVFTVDINPKFKPSICKNILEVTKEEIIEKFGYPDVIWASPPCTTFSVASIYRYWEGGKPKNVKTLEGIEIVKKTLKLIKELNPKYFFIENPRGMLRQQEFMQPLHRKTITYCQYGFQQMKPTDIWTNVLEWNPKKMCSPKSPCHIRGPRGSKFGIQGIKARQGFHPDSRYVISRSAELRAIVPPKLIEEILDFVELYPKNNTLNDTKPKELEYNSSYTSTQNDNKTKA